MDETRITGDLPNMRVEITRSAEPDGSAEYMTIQVTATPDFRTALPLPSLFQIPMLAWQSMMAPWMRLMGVQMPPALSPLTHDGTPALKNDSPTREG